MVPDPENPNLIRPSSVARGASLLFLCLSLSFPAVIAQTVAPASELRATHAFDEARREGPAALRAFLYRMPKGADLHSHLSGAVYAETFLREAGEDHDCVNAAQLSIDDKHHEPDCPAGESPATAIPSDQHLDDELIDALSMRTFVPTTGESGHDHFFDTFARFGDDNRFAGEWIDEVATRAAAQNEQYLELMQTGNYAAVRSVADKLGWDPDLTAFRTRLLADPAFHQNVVSLQSEFAAALERRKYLEHCDQPSAAPACSVTVRFLYQVKREEPPQEVFAQSLLGFELAASDPDVVGINLVQPEDSYIAMRDYRLQMRMFGFLHSLYPRVHISLHAGELAEGLVPPEGLTFHIRSAVEQGHADRIGHGVDIMFEDHPWQLMQEMADRHIMVEINLTSNDVILNVQGNNHPFMLYRKAGVPVALSTDDEGVSRIDLTHEFVRAAETYPLTYHDLKLLARTSLEHAFLPGDSLWVRTTPENLDTPVAACRGQLGDAEPRGACAGLIHSSLKARQEWELERRFRVFESSF